MERRRTTRHATAGHVWWSLLGDVLRQHGWLSDMSSEGISFVTPRVVGLDLGDEIAVSENRAHRNKPSSQMRTFTIRRVEPYDENLSLVACSRKRP